MVKDNKLNIRLDDGELEKLQAVALAENSSISEVIRRSLAYYGVRANQGSYEAMNESLANVIHVQQIIIEQLNSLVDYNRHLIWVKADTKTVYLDGHNVKCYPLYRVRAVKRG